MRPNGSPPLPGWSSRAHSGNNRREFADNALPDPVRQSRGGIGTPDADGKPFHADRARENWMKIHHGRISHHLHQPQRVSTGQAEFRHPPSTTRKPVGTGVGRASMHGNRKFNQKRWIRITSPRSFGANVSPLLISLIEPADRHHRSIAVGLPASKHVARH